MLHISPKLLENLYNRDFIVYGTGWAGKMVIPYLANNPNIRLHGVTNSSIICDDAGTFLDTNLPIRSIQRWAELMPNAEILVCLHVLDPFEDIYRACQKVGFEKVMLLPADTLLAIINLHDIGYKPSGHPALNLLCFAQELHDLHKASFSEFKGCNRGRDVVVVGSGPSLNFYSQLKDASHIGVNETYNKRDIKLDYYFLWHNESKWCEELKKYDFVKFFGINDFSVSDDCIPEYVAEENHARRYYSGDPTREIHTNIEYYPLVGYRSIIFTAIQFATYTRPKRIFLAGCDCSLNGHFNGDIQEELEKFLIPVWKSGYKDMKSFMKKYYPEVEIISINPVGLKGMFHDMYTQSYLEAHPELNREECEVIDSGAFEKIE